MEQPRDNRFGRRIQHGQYRRNAREVAKEGPPLRAHMPGEQLRGQRVRIANSAHVVHAISGGNQLAVKLAARLSTPLELSRLNAHG
jgi:hypothetical protein